MPDVARLGSRTSGTGTTGSFTPPAGSNRVAFLATSEEASGMSADQGSVSWGGRAMTRAVSALTGTSGFGSEATLYYLGEADIAAMADGDFTISGLSGEVTWSIACFENVDQAALASADTNAAATTSSTPNPLTADLTVGDGAAVVAFASCGNATTANWTSGDTTEQTDRASASSSGSLSDGLFASGQAVDVACAWASQNRAALVSMALQAASGVAAGSGSSAASATASGSGGATAAAAGSSAGAATASGSGSAVRTASGSAAGAATVAGGGGAVVAASGTAAGAATVSGSSGGADSGLSDTAVEALIAASTSEVFIILVKIDHTEFAEPIRATSDAVDTVSSALGESAETFVPFPFDLRLHPDGPDEIGRARLRISNVGLEIMQGMRAVQGGELQVSVAVVLGSAPDTCEVGPLAFEAETVPWDALWVDCVLGGDSWLNDAWPYTQFTPGTAPGLWL